jgi:nucleotide-binding universal stress UspA family protein
VTKLETSFLYFFYKNDKYGLISGYVTHLPSSSWRYCMSDWKRMIIAIDDSQRSINAIEYVGSIAGHLADIHLCLLHIYPEPPPDYSRSGATLDDYKSEQEERAKMLFAQAKKILQQHGVAPHAISSRCQMAGGLSISAAILELQTEENYGTIVVGKRGISKAEEFLFGSISNALIHNGRDIAVWVIG